MSSTSVDLSLSRKEIFRFLNVLPADLLAMEFFGSDEAKPKEYCLQQVARSNFFIGIYAERYGSIDAETGYSITELEYRKAAQMLSDGTMSSILIYLIDEEEANWPIKHVERNPVAIEKLRELKELLKKSHVVTFFRNAADLPFLILKDVIKKLGVGEQTFRPKPASRIEKADILARPIGMESFAAGQSGFFRGRDQEINSLMSQVIAERFSLLVGASGIGKSSLIQAGLVPRLVELGWLVAIVRPIAPVVANMARHIWHQLMEGAPRSSLTLAGVVKACTLAHGGVKIAIVLDQFEDCAVRPAGETEQLISEVLELRNSNDCDARLLFSYRADVESEVGPIWQVISGSPGGLARVYLGPLSRGSALAAFDRTLEGSVPEVAAITPEERATLRDSVISDLEAESLANGFNGVFPPFLQMVLSTISRAAQKTPSNLLSHYRTAGGARKIIADFLLSQLNLLGKDEQIGRQILISLVSSYGTKAQKTSSEIAQESGNEKPDIERVLRRLLDLRLIREMQGTFEIIHDLLARRITDEIVAPEEKEAKRCQELLRSRTSAFEYTGSLLSYSEHLYVYRFRGRISVGEEQVRYLFLSALANQGPIFYWLAKVPAESVGAWLSEKQIDLRTFRSGHLVRHARSSPALDWVPSRPKSLIPRLLDDDPVVREKAKQQLVEVTESVESNWVRSLAASTSVAKQLALVEICFKLSASLPPDEAKKQLSQGPIAHSALAAIALTRGSDPTDIDLLLHLAETCKSRKLAFHYSFAALRLAVKLNLIEQALGLINHSMPDVAKGAIAAADDRMGGQVIQAIVGRIERWPELVASAVARLATADDLDLLWRLLISRFANAAVFNEIATAILKLSDSSAIDHLLTTMQSVLFPPDLKYSRELFATAAAKVNSTQMADFRSALDDPMFWTDVPERAKLNVYGSTIIASAFNSYRPSTFYLRWFVGTIFSLLAKRDDTERLFRLLNHSYWNLRNSAALRLLEILQIEDLDRVVDEASAHAAEETDITRSLLHDLDLGFYSSTLQVSQKGSAPPAGPL